jgi:hypothetical protein
MMCERLLCYKQGVLRFSLVTELPANEVIRDDKCGIVIFASLHASLFFKK